MVWSIRFDALHRRLSVLTAGCIVFTGTAAAAGPSVQLLADGCAACHGTDGRSPGPIDSLAGMRPGKFLEEMQKFRDRPGEGRIMKPIAQALTETQTRDLADYFARISR